MNKEYRMPIGCAFDVNDLFYTFDYEKVQVPKKVRRKYIQKTDRYIDFVSFIFKSVLRYIIEDIVETGTTFKLPLAGKTKAYIKIDCEKDNCFKNFRKAGKWKNLNFFETMFTGPSMNLHFVTSRGDKKKIIICDVATVNRMVEKCNQGFLYGDKNLDKTINDYYDAAFKMFPDVPLDDIKEILHYGWRMLYLHRIQGGEIKVRVRDFSCFFGIIHKDRSKLLSHYCHILAKKLRITACKKKFIKTKYYYAAFNDDLYQEFLKTKKIEKGKLYLLYEECFVTEYRKTHIIKIKLSEFKGYTITVTNYKVDDYELVLTRPPSKFQDVCTLNNDYIILSYKGPRKDHSYFTKSRQIEYDAKEKYN